MNFIRIIALIMLFSFSNLLHAQVDHKRAIATCAAKTADAERLICFDQLARALGVQKPATKTIAGKGKWVVTEETSPIDDSKTVTLYLEAEEAVGSGHKRAVPNLIVACRENRTELLIAWGMFITTREPAVLTRLDRNKASTRSWLASTNYEATFYRGSPIAFLKSMFGKHAMIAQVTPHGENPVLASFKIAGIDEAIKPLRATCGW